MKKAVALARTEAYGGLYESLESMEGEKEVYRIDKKNKGTRQARMCRRSEFSKMPMENH